MKMKYIITLLLLWSGFLVYGEDPQMKVSARTKRSQRPEYIDLDYQDLPTPPNPIRIRRNPKNFGSLCSASDTSLGSPDIYTSFTDHVIDLTEPLDLSPVPQPSCLHPKSNTIDLTNLRAILNTSPQDNDVDDEEDEQSLSLQLAQLLQKNLIVSRISPFKRRH
jgi:hypothetical protein